MAIQEREVIGNTPIQEITRDLSKFRDYSTARDRRGMDNYAQHSVITQPHAVMVFEDADDYRIAQGSLTNHHIIEKAFNDSRMMEGKSKSRKMISGVVFSTKENPDTELIRIDPLQEDITPEANQIIERISEKGYTVFDALYRQFGENPAENN